MDTVSARRTQLLKTLKDRVNSDDQRSIRFDDLVKYPELQADIEALVSDGLLGSKKRQAGYVRAAVSPTGEALLSELHQLQSAGTARKQETRRSLASWINSQLDPSFLHHLSRFLESPDGSYYGTPYEESEASAAGMWLRDHGYAETVDAWGNIVIRISLTNRGIDWVEGGFEMGTKSPVSVYFNGDVNNSQVQVGGSGSRQNMSISTDILLKVKETADGIRQTIPLLTLSTADEEKLEASLDELETMAESPNPEPAKMKALVNAISTFLRDSTAGAIGGTLATGLTAVLQML
jgi:hypothetical protein